jgi:hypothetical protein
MNQKYQIQLKNLADLISDNHSDITMLLAESNVYLAKGDSTSARFAWRKLNRAIGLLNEQERRLNRTAKEIASITDHLEF